MRGDASRSATDPVPPGYRGVWQRTLLETPTQRDTSTWVRWLQTERHHADPRTPNDAPREVAAVQGFAGSTEVVRHAGGEVCHWHREVDLQPAGPYPDAGWMVFETSERVIETGVHGVYREVWERLPGSTGRCLVLARDARAGVFHERLLLSGEFLMRVRARAAVWPALQAGDSLATVVARHPAQAAALLDFEISFGRLAQGRWQIERSSVPALEGCRLTVVIERTSELRAHVHAEADAAEWAVVEWAAGAERVG